MFCHLDRESAIAAGFKPLSEEYSKFAIVNERNGAFVSCHGWTLTEKGAADQAIKRNLANKQTQDLFARTMKKEVDTDSSEIV